MMNPSVNKKCCGCDSSSDLHEYSVWAAESIDVISVHGKMETRVVPICRKCELADPDVAKRRSRSFRIALTCTAISLLGLLLFIPLAEWANQQKSYTGRLKGGLPTSFHPGLFAIALFSITFGLAPVYALKHWLWFRRRTFGGLAIVRKLAAKWNKADYRVFGPGKILDQNADGGVVDPDPAFSPYILAYDVAMQPANRPRGLDLDLAAPPVNSIDRQRKNGYLVLIAGIALGVGLLIALTGRNRQSHEELDRSIQDVPRTPKAHPDVKVENKTDLKN